MRFCVSGKCNGAFAKVLCLAVPLLIAGCNSRSAGSANSANPNSATDVSRSNSAQSPPDPAEVVSLLETNKAELVRGSGSHISQVSFEGEPITDAIAAELHKLPALQSLVINNSQLSLEGWQRIGQLKQLRQLDLRDCSLNNEQLTAALSGLTQLTSLRMSGKNGATTVDDGGMASLKPLSNLKVLAADYLWISETGLKELQGAKSLRELYLANSLVDDAGLEAIAQIPNLKKLRVAKTGIGRPGLEKLTALALEELDLSECNNIDDSALEPVGKIRSLKKLNLWRDAIGDSGAAYLSPLVNLQWLNVDNTQLTDAGLQAFKGFDQLTFLHLGSTAVSDAGMPQLLALKNLKELKVTRTSVTEAGVEALKSSRPELQIQLRYGEEETP